MADNTQGQPSGSQSAGPQQPSKQVPLNQLLTPEKIGLMQLPIPDDQKKRYRDGATVFWTHINSKPPSDPQHQEALNKLTQLTVTLNSHVKNLQRAQPQQGGQPQPATSQGAPRSQPMQRPPSQGQAPAGANAQVTTTAPQQDSAQARTAPQVPAGNQMMENIRRTVDKINLVAPPGDENPQRYKAEVKKKWAEALYQKEMAIKAGQQLEKQATQYRGSGQQMPTELLQQRASVEAQLKKANDFIQSMTHLQTGYRQQQASATSQQAARNASAPNINNASGQNLQQASQQQPPTGANLQNPQQRPMPQNAAQQQFNRQAGSPQAQASTPAALSQQANQQQFQRPQPPNQASAGPFSQQAAANSMPTATQQPNPYTQQGSNMEQRSYSSGGTAQQAGPQMTNQQFNTPSGSDKATRWPMTKDFTPQQPRPVQMGQMRPTMAGPNNGPMGPMGQPAIQQTPSYNLHGPGDHVLDKKKLDELVRQVCGAGDGSAAQGLHPEVEESILELADEFFDNVVSAACRLAKVRGSPTLEIKDLQLTLQRQYNIRIPGYSTDEIRTVRKVQPTASYLQKMNAIQAAKVMGGKVD